MGMRRTVCRASLRHVCEFYNLILNGFKAMIKIQEDWEFNVLGIYNFLKPGRFDALFKFIQDNHSKMPGDIVEAGVYRGSSLIALGMFLKQLGSDKKVYGFDSFAGFPPIYHPKDALSNFERMYEARRIDDQHIMAVRKNRQWWQTLHAGDEIPITEGISSSGTFSDTSISLLKRKIELVGLDNIILVDGPFNETMKVAVTPTTIMAAVMDCDLYRSYLDAFKFIWPRLSTGGMIHLDEYYSLKFPGGRLATEEFIGDKCARLEMATQKPGDFQRWRVIKEC